jgi:signal transduction histidine kinase
VGTPSSEYPKVVTTPSPAVAPTIVRRGWFDRGVLAVAHFVPRQAAIGFPYVLFLLLLLFALSLYYQSTNEVRKDKLNRQFLIKRKSIRAQQDNFIALASHYLNTPITIIQNGIEVMEESEKGSKSK